MSKQLHEATLAQIKSAQPDSSTWLSANAGSGKTRVLTDRVARLLLSGVNPQNILCLTYTKAAASEMQNRLFGRLGAWAMKPEVELREELAELGEGGADAATLSEARRLFARAIETPGGLRIQTIHSFCASLLRRFPLEAGVTPPFTELDDRTAALLRENVLDTLSETSPEIVRDMAHVMGGNDAEKFTQQIVGKKAQFSKEVSEAEAKALFGLPDSLTEDSLVSEVFLGGELELISELQAPLMAGKPTDIKNAKALAEISQVGLGALRALEAVMLFTGSSKKAPFGAKIGSFPTKATQGAIEHLMPRLEALMLRVEAARSKRIALAAATKTLVLHHFARAFIARYEAQKAQRGWLDFDDLILKTKELLTDPAVAQWVLFRLDGGIDHILVDEAQDTSPAQWSVIEELAREITAGDGTREAGERTIFVVGDKKQSIYSFQGADSREFDKMRNAFADKLKHRDKPLATRSLAYSFRSSPAVLSVVDIVFESQEEFGVSDNEHHIAFHKDMPGRVDIWPIISKSEAADDVPWDNPVDLISPADPVSILAENIAESIFTMISERVLIPTKKDENDAWLARPVHEGDFLILMQSRSALFHEIIRACKAKGLDVAGADRLKVGEELAVKDITALLSFLTTEADDLSLATALRSPIFGWSEQQLFTLAHGRKAGLWEALRKTKDSHAETHAILKDLRDETDFSRPYELIERILTRHGGRKNFLKRLGHEAEDGIDAFLAQALAYERLSVPSLTGFLGWLESDDPEIKRQIESGGKRIRVMTVHGSKGLEAPIVIMPDAADRKNDVKDMVLADGSTAVWKLAKDESPEALRHIMDQKQAAQAAERERLLYVSMTRAEKWLIVAAAGDVKNQESWHNQISAASEALKFEEAIGTVGSFQRYEHGDWESLKTESNTPEITSEVTLEAFFQLPAPADLKGAKTLSPSALGGAKALSGDAGQDEEQAKQFGTDVHRLLEVLPEWPSADWAQIAQSLLGDGHITALTEARRSLEAPHLAHLFAKGTLSEVPMSAPSARFDARLHGIVDRLVVTEGEVLIVDYKTNATVPSRPDDTPLGLLRQMGAYAEAAQLIWPNKRITTAILWTKTAELMSLDHDLVIASLDDTPYLDVAPAAS